MINLLISVKNKVDDQNQWKEVAQAVGFPPGSCNVEVVMRKIYAKFVFCRLLQIGSCLRYMCFALSMQVLVEL